jgi:hypothetical protein
MADFAGIENITQGLEGLGETFENTLSATNDGFKEGLHELKEKILKVAVDSLPKDFLDLVLKVENMTTYTKQMAEMMEKQGKNYEDDQSDKKQSNQRGAANGWTPEKLASKLPESLAAPALTIVQSMKDIFGEKGDFLKALTDLLKNQVVTSKSDKKGKKDDGGAGDLKGPDDKLVGAYSASIKKLDKLFGGILKVFIRNKKPRFSPEQIQIIKETTEVFKNLEVIFKAVAVSVNAALTAGVRSIIAVVFLPFIATFIQKTKVVIDALYSIKKDTEKLKEKAGNIREIYTNLAFAEAAAIAGGVLAIPATVGVFLIMLFVLSTSLLLKLFTLIIKPKEVIQLATTAGLLKIAFSALFWAELFAIGAGILAIPAIVGVILSTIFMLGSVLLGWAASLMLPFILPLTITSVLLAVAFAGLAIAVVFALVVTVLIMSKKDDLLSMPIALGTFFQNIVDIGGKTILTTMLFAIPLTIAALLLLVTFIALTLTVVFAIAFSKLFTKLEKREGKYVFAEGVETLFTNMADLGVQALIAMLVMIPVTVASVLMLATFIALTLTVVFILAFSKLMTGMDKTKSEKLKEDILALYSIVGSKTLIAKSLLITVAAIPILAASLTLMGIFGGIVSAYKSIKEIREIQGNIDPEPVFTAVDRLMDIVLEISTTMKGKSEKALKLFKIGVGAVTEAVGNIVDVIIKMADPKIIEYIPEARSQLTMIMNEFFGFTDKEPKPGSIMYVLENIKKIGLGKAMAAKALVPITESIQNIVDVVVTLSEMSSSVIMGGISNLNSIGEFSVNLGSFMGKIPNTRSVVERTQSIKAMTTMVGELSNLTGKAANLKDIRTNLQENILEPILKLDPAVKMLDSLKSAAHGLNEELKKMTAENKEAFSTLAGLNGNGGTTLRLSGGPQPAQVGSLSRNDNEYRDKALNFLTGAVESIEKNTRGETASWTDSRPMM